MDFKISEEIEENNNEPKKDSKLPIIIIVVCALVVGLLVFFLCNSLFNKKDTKPVEPTSEKRSLTEENVKILYQYVTYGTEGYRNDKFVKEDKVDISSFTDEEKFYYALQFAQVEDFVFTGELDKDNKKIYSISARTIKKYMQRFFGKSVTYTNVDEFEHVFTFSINGMNVGKMKYNEETLSYDTTFTEASEDEEKDVINPYVGKLVEAYKEPDGSYRLVEKVIYVKALEQADGKYQVDITRDYNHTTTIESSIDQSSSDLKKISIDKYIKKAATITYIFKLDTNSTLYFDSSSIK